MAFKPVQGTRMGSFTSPLGEDKLVITKFEGAEGLSELFDFRVDVLSETEDLDFTSALGTNCSLAIATKGGGKRCFSGVLTEAQWTGRADDLASYRLVLRPWLWLLSRTTNCKIFAKKTVPEIIEAVFGRHAFARFEKCLSGNYKPLEYCVQYRESDLNFVCRLMEEVGIYYFFDHDGNDHTLVLADSASAHKPKMEGASLSFYDNSLRTERKEDSINDWKAGRRFRSGRVMLKDYDYTKPTADLAAEKEASPGYANSSLEVFDFPGRYLKKPDGQTLANVRLEAEQAMDKHAVGEGDAVSVCPGHLVQIAKHPVGSVNREYLTLRATHAFRSNAYRAGASGELENYFGRYEFMPCDIPFRAIAQTRKPVIHGPQTAVVTGEGEIDVDEQGRIIVLFHWDRDRKDGDARRVRIAHGWSGKKWGDIKIPRVGMEVIVEFLEGDPDQPLVTGTVYNGDNTTPYDLPAEKSLAGTKSKTLDGSGYNEIVFDDKSGDELIRVHAQHDIDALVENDERRKVKNNQTIGVDKDVDVKIGQNRTEEIGLTWKVEAMQKIEFIVGASKIIMEPASIKMESVMIDIKAKAKLSAESAAVTEVKAGGLLTVQGGLVKIN